MCHSAWAGALREEGHWQLGRTSRSCFENICVFELKMIQRELHNLYKIKKKIKILWGLSHEEEHFVFFPQFQSKEKALHRFSFRRQSCFSGFQFSALCPCHWDARAQHRHTRELGRSWCRLKVTGRGLSDQHGQNFLNPHNIYKPCSTSSLILPSPSYDVFSKANCSTQGGATSWRNLGLSKETSVHRPSWTTARAFYSAR